ncbi:hypothetical protein SDC9_190201 [bioreactor metagenome]|uniref:Transcriptional regulator TetR C-terminal Firmicutes type domain-containing protein n=1 Tax=bioreactor metagenome TaxID=1076179 RepID=A0A645I2F0_9ZZZZ
MEYLIRKLPPEIAEAHALKDNFSVEQLFSAAPQIKSTSIRTLSAALRGIFMTMLFKHEIGDDIFDDALKAMIYGVVLQMFEEDTL